MVKQRLKLASVSPSLIVRQVLLDVIAHTSRNPSSREGRRRRESLVSRPADRRNGR